VDAALLATDSAGRWNGLTVAATYILCFEAGLRDQELPTLRRRDLSREFSLLVITDPKDVGRRGDSRVLVLSRLVLGLLDPILRGLDAQGRWDDLLLTFWCGDVRVVVSAATLRVAAAGMLGLSVSDLDPIGALRNQFATEMEQRALDLAQTEDDARRFFRARSAAMGHGQSGGWSPVLGCRPLLDMAEIMPRLDIETPPPSEALCPPPLMEPTM
jgi:integrase